MGLFGRNKKDDAIQMLKDKVNDLENSVKSLKQQKEGLMNSYSSNEEEINNLKKEVKKYENLINDLKEENDLLNSKYTSLEENVTVLIKKYEDITKKTPTTSKKTIEEPEEDINGQHLYNITSKQLAKPYSQLLLGDDGSIKAKSNYLILNIKDIVKIKYNITKYYHDGLTLVDIAKKYNVTNKNSMYRLVWNVEEGLFDEVIQKYQNNTYDYVKKSQPSTEGHLYKIKAKRNSRPYSKIELLPNGDLVIKGRTMPYTIKNVIDLKNTLKSYHEDGYKISKIMSLYPNITNLNTMYRLVWNIEEGVFDDTIEEYLNTLKSSSSKNVNENNTHFRSVTNSMKKPINKKLIKMDEGGELSINGRTLKYTIQDVLIIKQRIIDFNNYPTIESLFDYLDITNPTGEALVWRIEEGYFDDLIDEYLSRNYTYENNFNRLFIDGKNTGLSIDKCISIIECIINAPNKTKVVNNLIKMYPTIESKYIRMLADEYNNPNLSKVLKKEVKKVEKIDNPQKRRESGLY